MDCCQKKPGDNAKHSSFIKNKIFIFCLLGIGAAAVTVSFFKIPLSTLLTFSLLLLCPLMHLFMMKGHSMGNHQESGQDDKSKDKEKDKVKH